MKNDPHLSRENFAAQWQLPWHLINTVLDGKSSIDLTLLSVEDKESADLFLQSYGYDLNSPDEQKRVHAIFIEAFQFIEKVLIPKEWKKGLRPPNRLSSCKDFRQILIWASLAKGIHSKEVRVLQLWSCAILKLMHTISHLDDPDRIRHISKAREQIISRMQKKLFRNSEEITCFGNQEDHVPLIQLDWKMQKERESILLKLLHKPANVAETVYDHIGVRFITSNQADTLRLLALLKQNYIIDFANLHPTRTRNSLVDSEHFKKNIAGIRDKVVQGKMSVEEARLKITDLDSFPIKQTKENPHSSKKFRSIQLTCRQRVQIHHPETELIARMMQAAEDANISKNEKNQCENILRFIAEQSQITNSNCKSIFFPFEVQIIDQKTYQQTQQGDASHGRYKASQIRAARKRIMGKILDLK